MKSKYFRILLAVAFAAISFPFVSVKADTKVGMLLPLSGNYAAVGVDNRQGIEAALELSPYTGSLNIEYADSKADATVAVSEFRKLTNDEQVVAVYAMRGPVGMAINPISKAIGVPILGGVGNKDFAAMNEYAYQFWSTSDEEGRFLANALKSNRLMKVALLTAQDDWPVAVSKAFRERVKANNGSIVYDQEYIPSELDFRTAIAQLKSKAPDVVFANLGINQLAPFFKQAREFKLALAIYSNFWAAKKDVINAAGIENVEGIKFVEMNTALPSFQKTVAEKFKSTPSGATLSAYAGTLLFLQVAAKHPEARSPLSFNRALTEMREIETPDGPLFIKDRRVEFPLIERTIHGGNAE